MADVELIEVGPRDGLQNEAAILPAADKVRLIERSIAAGLRRIEAVSFVNPRRVPQMADAEAVMERLPRVDGVSYIGLVLNRRGLDRALAAGVDEVNVVVVSTDEFSRRNQGCSVEEGVRTWARIAEDARAAGVRRSVTLAAAFGCPFEGEVPADRVLDLVRRVAESEPDEIALADTIGVGVPAQVRTLLTGAAEIAPDVPLRCHFHNTRNTGYANALTALDHGVSALDASTGGFGGCPFAPAATGNIATEDLVYALDRSGVATGVDMGAVTETAAWLSERLGSPVQALLGRAGPFPS
ncbi:hydroxymethylglutaryl-CoA lyase [Actinomadura hallensis]|uniref:Hydroxymethylglutaryl-CoA lyase n=1 Tax=Actinomadura hallensis TaxID=337895 RepID=A0A543I8J8_9ACTN|nr:hydroxymethylglutaryl-CoA lyase [Actinomadura hallensis]TQM66932.1 hydroxymethylglutaryl-CoA lyase [Actinomadura hallensis]HLV72375.1 hydroxymethylglutaryl-CoA lyase [Vulgatibacteraceae bacterium]